MGFTEKTNYLLETKSLLKDRINSLGGSITPGTTFRDYLVWLDSLYEALDEKTITGLPESLEGKCEQEGTPTPSSPVPVETTTGRQVVSVCAKNLLYKDFYQSSANAIKCELLNFPSGTYTWSFTNQNIPGEIQVKTKVNGSYQTYANAYSKNQLTFTLNTSQDIQLESYRAGGNPLSNYSNMMINKGQTALPYEEYKGNDYEINLGKNLLNLENLTTRTLNGITITKNEDGSVVINGTSTGATTFDIELPSLITFEQGFTYTSSQGTKTSIGAQYSLTLRHPNLTSITNASMDSSASSTTFTMSATEQMKYYRIFVPNGITLDNQVIYPMIEKGSQPSSYAPYKTPIYLGKIGTYQDYIFRNTTENPLYDSNLEEGQWYIHKEIGRVVLNGSENWWGNGDTTNYGQYAMNLTGKKFGVSNIISSHFITDLSNQKNCIAGRANNNVIAITIEKSIVNYNASTFKTWLASNNIEVYYVLNTPTNTLIEDEELINQLNEIDIFTVISEDFYN